jgi:DNA processing protein
VNKRSVAWTNAEHCSRLCALRVEGQSVDWSLIAREVERSGGVKLLCDGTLVERSKVAVSAVPVLRAGLKRGMDAARERVELELDAAQRVGAQLVTVLDDDYPSNLRLIPDLPPFLFVRGELRPDDALSVAVVGTRDASDDGPV